MSLSERAAAGGKLSRTEFTALMAMLFATIAFSTDAMLPAMPTIVEELTADAPNRAQLIITFFMLGMGIGTLVTGPLSDAYGRKPTILACAGLYIGGSLLAWAAPTLELLLAARVIQGLGAAGPRIVGLAIVRDQYAGREMARLVSFIFLVFSLFPAVAPLIGQGIIAAFGWRAIFLMFVLFIGVSSLWLLLRQPETLPHEARVPFRAGPLWQNVKTVISDRTVRFTIAVQIFIFAQLLTILSTTQPVFDEVFGKADSFALWFAVIALCASTSSFVNARFVMTVGMRGMVIRALVGVALISISALVITQFTPQASTAHFVVYLIWVITLFYQMGLTMGNLNALALEPMGRLAGTATSVIGSVSTAFAVAVGTPIGQFFDGTTTPLILGCLISGLIALGIMLWMGNPDK
ncbi:multidrug effflux MFS transporter [Vannielia litorea]|uniref:MFS transporter, DHA1 family, bicyclomycin/chloramphenicol resistance protein n=1 Tax=Vannielia litorea TaxID=1217970 RepID=A0A1N6F911_9RHOB|nr:multidrug effflux MFS transporter [Vannielia litorea]SIN91765.1 MFS transporter, DHA1 family, bicyclomycin/chloramphenicol resistance protein [Vannielia litorea]